MYAIVRSGGKQYKVEPGKIIKVERVAGEKGGIIDLCEVMMVNDGQNVILGNPTIHGARVKCEILEEEKLKKIIIFKHKRRKNYRKKIGHRQVCTALMVKEIIPG